MVGEGSGGWVRGWGDGQGRLGRRGRRGGRREDGGKGEVRDGIERGVKGVRLERGRDEGEGRQRVVRGRVEGCRPKR